MLLHLTAAGYSSSSSSAAGHLSTSMPVHCQQREAASAMLLAGSEVAAPALSSLGKQGTTMGDTAHQIYRADPSAHHSPCPYPLTPKKSQHLLHHLQSPSFLQPSHTVQFKHCRRNPMHANNGVQPGHSLQSNLLCPTLPLFLTSTRSMSRTPSSSPCSWSCHIIHAPPGP